MSEDSHRTIDLGYGQDSLEKSQTISSFYLWTYAKWDNIRLTHY